MLIDLQRSVRRLRMSITGIIHVGAHYGEEWEAYRKITQGPVIFIEPCKKAFEILYNKLKEEKSCELFNVACGSEYSKMTMHVEERNGGQSNSLLKPMKHLEHYPDIKFIDEEEVTVMPLDLLAFDKNKYNLLAMDCQGFEGEVLKGATETLKHIKYIYTEVNRAELYQGCAQVEDIERFLRTYGFRRMETKWTGQGWGDSIFVKK